MSANTLAELVWSERAPWHREQRGDVEVLWAGDRRPVDELLVRWERGLDLAAAAAALRSVHSNFAIIVRAPSFMLAAVDKIRSIPVFYVPDQAPALVSNCARMLRKRAGLEGKTSAAGVLEVITAGYVTGRGTVCEGLFQLQGGELALWQGGVLQRERYYRYFPQPRPASEADLLAEYAPIVTRAFERVIEQANGRPIWIPLSGGYDSRLIVCKLHELGYPDITTFSYGPRLNHDALVARHVAKTLGLKWLWLPSHAAGARSSFHEPTRRDYWDFTDGLSIIPTMREWQALSGLVRDGRIPANAVVVNGQSGDFISGGHIPRAIYNKADPTVDDLYTAFIDKHWSLWTNWKTGPVLDRIKARIYSELHEPETRLQSKEDLIAQYESWEAQERQYKFVVNGQRMYEFFGLDWALPHWDADFLDFWEKVPFEHKLGQGLYKKYLAQWNYHGLFGAFDPFNWRWPIHMMWVIPLARAAGLLFGSAAKDRMYRRMWYFSHYHNHYVMYGYRNYLRTLDHARGPISLQVEYWLRENGLTAASPNEGQAAVLPMLSAT